MNSLPVMVETAAIPELPSEARRVLVILNPTAGRGKKTLGAILQDLERYGCVVSLRETTAPGDAGHIAEREGPLHDVVAVAGGDGTINEVTNGLARLAAPPALAIIPLGTANVVAWEISLGTDAARVARTIAEGRPIEIYPGIVNGRRFVIMCGVGFDAAVVASVDTRLKRRWGKLAYVWRMMVEMVRYDFPTFIVTVDGVAYRAASAVIAKGHFYGGRFICAPDAKLTEPSFEVCLFLRGGTWHALRYSLGLALGRLSRMSTIRIVRGQRIDLAGPADAPIQADGEVVARLPATIQLQQQSMRLLSPSDRSRDR